MKLFESPDIKVGGLQLWVYPRDYVGSTRTWDNDWLDVRAEFTASNAQVSTSGPILRLDELKVWLTDLQSMNVTLSGSADLRPIESYFCIQMAAESLGRIAVRVEITPDHLFQGHWFEFDLDQSYLGGLIRDIQKVLARV